MEKKQLLEEMPKGKPKEVENLREEVRPTPKKTKFKRKTTEDDESSCGFVEEMDLRIIMIGTIPIPLKCSTIFLTLPNLFKSKEMKESLVEVEKEHSPIEEAGTKR